MFTGWTPKSGVNLYPFATLEAGLTSACQIKLSKHVGHILPAPTEVQRAGWALSTGRSVLHSQKAELQGTYFWWPRWSNFTRSYICIFQSSLTLDLSHVATLAWFASTMAPHENLVSIRSCIVQCPLRILSPNFNHRNTLLLILLDFSLKSKQYFLLFSPNVLVFSYRKSRFYDKALISGWRLPLSQLCNTE